MSIINRKSITGLLGGGVTALVASLGGVALSNKIDYDKKIKYYGELNKVFSKGAPEHIRKSYYMPKWEDDERGKKVHTRSNGKISGRSEVFSTYQKMRDACYEFVSKDNDFGNCGSGSESGCTDCTRDRSWDGI